METNVMNSEMPAAQLIHDLKDENCKYLPIFHNHMFFTTHVITMGAHLELVIMLL
jgi:hypothetical protein